MKFLKKENLGLLGQTLYNLTCFKSLHYSVFRRSVPQNFEEYVVTAPR